MRACRFLLPLLGALFALPLFADELVPPSAPIEQAIDHYIDAKLKEPGITPAAPTDDATLVRRLTLDLVGRIPTVAETREFVESKEPTKRAKLVERLMASGGFVRHQANEFDAMLMLGTGSSVRPYLLAAFEEKKPWDRVFRELMLPSETTPSAMTGKRGGGSGAPGDFLRARVTDLDK